MIFKRKRKIYACEEVIKDIDFYFSRPENSDEMAKALIRALDHMTEGTTREKHNVSCSRCWNYYQEMKRRYCGG